MVDDPPFRHVPRDDAPATDPVGGQSPRSVLRARELLGRHDRVVIEHDGALYELRLTRNNKLILTK